jgi:hypothetical protein
MYLLFQNKNKKLYVSPNPTPKKKKAEKPAKDESNKCAC